MFFLLYVLKKLFGWQKLIKLNRHKMKYYILLRDTQFYLPEVVYDIVVWIASVLK